MKLKLSRVIAILLIVIPGILSTYGFILMKEAFFAQFEPTIGHFLWGKLILGLFLFILGIFFLGGWILFRDRKRNYVVPRFKEKRKQPK